MLHCIYTCIVYTLYIHCIYVSPQRDTCISSTIEQGENGVGGIQAREMNVTAVQESEGGAGEQSREGHDERTRERNDDSTCGTKRTREDDEGRAGRKKRQKEQAAEQGCRSTTIVHNAHTTPTFTTTTRST